MKSVTLLTDRSNIRNLKLEERDLAAEPTAGQALLKLERFALTANNISYASAGESMGYWNFFPAEPGWGKIPVWGIAEVVQSKAEGLEVGERVYGFFPMSSHLVVQPAGINPHSFVDGVKRRADLPPIYNQYTRLAAEPGYDASMDDQRVIFQPLFATAFLLDDFFGEHDFFDAERVIIGSASSKTAISLAYLLADRTAPRPRILGLTSAGNRGFVSSLDYYDEVASYNQVPELATEISSVFIDMAGNPGVVKALHSRLGDGLEYSCAVGVSHWEETTGDISVGGLSKFFFAPSQAEKRHKQWGGAELGKRIMSQWYRFSLASKNWMSLRRGDLATQGLDLYQALIEGRVPPSEALVITL